MGAAAGVLAATDGDWSEEQVIQQLLPHYVKQPEKCLRVHNALVQLVMLEKDRQLSMKKETEVSARHAEREGGAHRRSQELEREKQLLAKKQELENELNRRKASLKQQGGGVVPADGEVQRMSGDLVRVINMARANPSSMVPYAEEHLKSFVDEYSYEDPLNRPNTLISTQEGRKGVMDCITFLQAASAVGQVEPNLCLENVASEYAHQTMSNAQFRPPAIGDLINKQGRWRGSIGQTVSYGNKDPFAIVLALLIDDGSVDKGHRRSIFDEKFLQVGAVLSKHDPDGYCCVIEYATAVFSWDTQQVDDVNVSFSQWTRDYSQNEELFRKVVASIPNDNIEQEVDDLLRPRGSVVSIDFLPSRDRASIVQMITDPRTNSKSTTTLTVTWGGDKRRTIADCAGSEVDEASPGHSQVTEGELPSLSKFRAESVPISKFKPEYSNDGPSKSNGAWESSIERQPQLKMGKADVRPVNGQVKDGESMSDVDPSHQVLVFDMRQP